MSLLCFLIVLKTSESKVKVLADSVSGKSHLLSPRWPSSCCVLTAEELHRSFRLCLLILNHFSLCPSASIISMSYIQAHWLFLQLAEICLWLPPVYLLFQLLYYSAPEFHFSFFLGFLSLNDVSILFKHTILTFSTSSFICLKILRTVVLNVFFFPLMYLPLSLFQGQILLFFSFELVILSYFVVCLVIFFLLSTGHFDLLVIMLEIICSSPTRVCCFYLFLFFYCRFSFVPKIRLRYKLNVFLCLFWVLPWEFAITF